MTTLGKNLNFASKKEHVPEIERFIQTAKERVRSAQATVPIKRYPSFMIVNLVASTIFGLNDFPPSTPGAGLSDTKGPGKIILGNTVDYKNVFPPPSSRICPSASRR